MIYVSTIHNSYVRIFSANNINFSFEQMPWYVNKPPSNQLYITNKMEGFSFKSGHAVRVMELIKEDWPIVLQ